MPKKPDYVTQSTFDSAMDRIAQRFDELGQRVEDTATKADLAGLETKFDDVLSNLDTYVKRSESWHDEQVVLRASHQRLKDALIRKGIVSDSEVAV